VLHGNGNRSFEIFKNTLAVKFNSHREKLHRLSVSPFPSAVKRKGADFCISA
jgi:hypothetical protein